MYSRHTIQALMTGWPIDVVLEKFELQPGFLLAYPIRCKIDLQPNVATLHTLTDFLRKRVNFVENKEEALFHVRTFEIMDRISLNRCETYLLVIVAFFTTSYF